MLGLNFSEGASQKLQASFPSCAGAPGRMRDETTSLLFPSELAEPDLQFYTNWLLEEMAR